MSKNQIDIFYVKNYTHVDIYVHAHNIQNIGILVSTIFREKKHSWLGNLMELTLPERKAIFLLISHIRILVIYTKILIGQCACFEEGF